MKSNRHWIFGVIPILIAAAATLPALADVIVLNRGDRLEGIVTPAPGKSDAVVFQNHKTRMEINRSLIRTIEEEPDSVDWRRIGDQFFNDRFYESALEAYRKSASFDPNDPKTAEQIQAAEAALAREATLERRRELERVDRMLDQAEQHVTQKEFERADALLAKDIPALKPTAEQQKRITEIKKSLYKGWALEKEDKLLPGEAAVYFEKLLTLDPLDRYARERLLAIWEKTSEKTPQVINAYRIQLKLNPNDNVTRRKLADKLIETARTSETLRVEKTPAQERAIDNAYEMAVQAYEMLRKEDGSLPPDVADKVTLCLTSLYLRAEQRLDYDRAVRFFTRLQNYSRRATDETLHTLEFRRDALKLAATDADGLTSLILRARAQGLNDLALVETRRLKNRFPESEAVNNVLKMYAGEMLGRASEYVRTLQYERADGLANEILRDKDFSAFPEVGEEANKIIGQARVEIEKSRRLGSEDAKKYKELGDNAYFQGVGYMNRIGHRDYDPGVRIVSPLNEAIRYFRDAIRYYDQAVSMWPGMDDVTRREIAEKRRNAARYLAVLTSQTPIELPRGPSRLGR